MANSFDQIFYCSSQKTYDTGELKFENGDVLSSIGEPNSTNRAYYNRTGIADKVIDKWK